ncbi:MAG: NYN domain-containing protein [Anaerolineae bacterium]
MTRKVAVVDGANVAYEEMTTEGKPKVANIVQVRKMLKERGYDVIVILDASLRYDVDDPAQLEGLLGDEGYRQAPAETQADYFILAYADELGALIVSNDQFEEYRGKYPWIEERRVPLMIIEGRVKLFEPKIVPSAVPEQ